MRTAKWGIAVMLTALTACGGDNNNSTGEFGDGSDVPECTEVTRAGRPTDDVIAELGAGTGCMDGGTVNIITTMSWDCPDGRRVHSSDWGWGFAGDVWHSASEPAPYADCVLPGTDAHHP